MSLGLFELILIILVILIIFGAGKLPQVGEALGKSIREFKKSQREDTDKEEKKDLDI